jgi:hypothetical protein
VGSVPPLVTDGAFLPDGRAFVLRDYQEAFVYAAPGRRVATFPLPIQYQGESVAVSADGRSVLAGSEGSASEVWRVPLPEAVLARVAPTTRPPPAPAPAPTGGRRRGTMPFLAVAAAALVLLVAAVGVRRRRS